MQTERIVASAPVLHHKLPEIVIESVSDVEASLVVGRKNECQSAPQLKTNQQSSGLNNVTLSDKTISSVKFRKNVGVAKNKLPLLRNKNDKKRMSAMSTCEAVEIGDSTIASVTDLVNASMKYSQEPTVVQLPKLRRTMTYAGQASGGLGAMARKYVQPSKTFDEIVPSKSFPEPRVAQAGYLVYFRAETPAIVKTQQEQTVRNDDKQNVVWLKLKHMAGPFAGQQVSSATRSNSYLKTLRAPSTNGTRPSDDSSRSSEGSLTDESECIAETERVGTVSRAALIGSATFRQINTPAIAITHHPDGIDSDDKPHWPETVETRIRTKNITRPPTRFYKNNKEATRARINDFTERTGRLKLRLGQRKLRENNNNQVEQNGDKVLDYAKMPTHTSDNTEGNRREDKLAVTPLGNSRKKQRALFQPPSNVRDCLVAKSNGLQLSVKLPKSVSFVEENYSKYARRRTPARLSSHSYKYNPRTKMGYLNSKLKKPELVLQTGEDYLLEAEDSH